MREVTKDLVKGIGSAALIAALAYSRPARHWYLTYGATPDEVDQAMPGDELVPGPALTSTRAITIDAPPSAVWPWLVQMGSRRSCRFRRPSWLGSLPRRP